MPEPGVATASRFQVRQVAPNGVDPQHMSATERIHEVTTLLTVGFLRYWQTRAPDGREKGLDVLRTSSDVCPKPSSEGENA